MSNYRPLFYFIASLFILGIFVNIAIAPFVEVSEISPDSTFGNTGMYSYLLETVEAEEGAFHVNTITLFEGVSFFGFSLEFNVGIPSANLFGFLPTGARAEIIENLTLVTYIPDIVLIPLIVLGILGTIWTIIKLFLA